LSRVYTLRDNYKAWHQYFIEKPSQKETILLHNDYPSFESLMKSYIDSWIKNIGNGDKSSANELIAIFKANNANPDLLQLVINRNYK
jgi:hypothetical protein